MTPPDLSITVPCRVALAVACANRVPLPAMLSTSANSILERGKNINASFELGVKNNVYKCVFDIVAIVSV
jgi:hypothetical protein